MVLSTLLIWAAPAQVILISTLTTASLLEVAIAVTLSQRAVPADGRGAPADVQRARHAAASSAPADASDRDQRLGRGDAAAADVPRGERVAFYNGLGTGLMSAAADRQRDRLSTGGEVPPLLAATLLFLTPMALLMSSRATAGPARRLAFALGLVVGPMIAAQKIGLDLMWTGIDRGHHRLCGPSAARGDAMTRLWREIGPYLALILVGFLPNEMWRWLGLVLVRGLTRNRRSSSGCGRWRPRSWPASLRS